MKIYLNFIAIIVAAQLSGCTPSVYAVFRNLVGKTVTVTLTNPHGEAYCRAILPANAVKKCDVQYGRAVVTDDTGTVIANVIVSQPGSERYFDFDRKSFYFDIKPSRLVPVAVSVGRQWVLQ